MYGFLQNLLLCTFQNHGTDLQLDVMDYIWNELWNGIISRKAPVFAPYVMKFICDRWEKMDFGNLIAEVHTTPHKLRKLTIKVHTAPSIGKGKKSATSDESVDVSAPMVDTPKGCFARLQA